MDHPTADSLEQLRATLAMIRPYVVPVIVITALYLGSAFLATRLLRSIGASRGHDRDRIRGLIAAVKRGLMLLFGLILAVVLGVDLTNMPTYVGSLVALLGVALFAHWSILSNFTAGMILFSTKDLGLGDRIRILDGDQSVEGRIIEFRLMTLVLRQDDSSRVIYPNTLVMQKALVCLSPSRESVNVVMNQNPPAATL